VASIAEQGENEHPPDAPQLVQMLDWLLRQDRLNGKDGLHAGGVDDGKTQNVKRQDEAGCKVEALVEKRPLESRPSVRVEQEGQKQENQPDNGERLEVVDVVDPCTVTTRGEAHKRWLLAHYTRNAT
jgi:hypothetical protein